jgi:tetratricopeptide (TPR) repeat protein
VGGAAYDAAKATPKKTIEFVLAHYRDPKEPANHDLHRAVRRAYLEATYVLCETALYRIDPKWYEHILKVDANVRWLYQRINAIDKALEQLGGKEEALPSSAAAEQTELLLPVAGEQAQINQELLQQALHKELRQELCLEPAGLKDAPPKKTATQLELMIAKGWDTVDNTKGNNIKSKHLKWFDLLCAFFVDELKNNQVVNNIFQDGILAGLAANKVSLPPQPDFQAALNKVSGEVARQVAAEFPKILAEFKKLSQQLAGISAQVDGVSAKMDKTKEEIIEEVRKIPHPTLTAPAGTAPSPPKLFVEREKDVAELLRRLTGSNKITLVQGWPGVGKSSLVAAIAHNEALKTAFPDGVLWVALGPQPSVSAELGNWLTSFGLDPREFPTPENRSQRLAAILRDRKMLLIVDDVWEAAHAQPFLVGGADCRTLLTTREPEVPRRLGLPNQAVYKLEVLSEEASLHLLRELAPQVVQDDPTGSRQLVVALDGLPLALHVAGRLLAAEAEMGWGIGDLLKELAGGTRLLQEQAPADRSTHTIAVLLEQSTNRLDADSRERFAMLSIFAPKPDTTFDAPAVAAAWGVDDPKPTLRTLVDRGLLEPASGRFQMHALLAVHAKSLHSAEAQTARRLAAYYTALAEEQAALGLPGYRRLDPERPHLMALLAGCTERQEWQAAKDLAWAVEDYLNLQGYWTERVQAIEAGLAAARGLNDKQGEGAFLGNLGNAYAALGQVERAIGSYEQALVISREIGDRRGEGSDLGNLGIAYRNLGQVEKARTYLTQALAIFVEIKSPSANVVRKWLAVLG